MTLDAHRTWSTQRDQPGLRRIANRAGLGVDLLPGGNVYAIEHRIDAHAILVNQVLASPLDGGIGRMLVRAGGRLPQVFQAVGPAARVRFGSTASGVTWVGEHEGILHRASLALHPEACAWVWRLELENTGSVEQQLDAVLIQDIGLGPPGFLANSEAFASQYIDHHVADHPRYGAVVMCRQNLAQAGRHPWVAHGCFPRTEAFATDGLQVFGPGYREAPVFPFGFGSRLPSVRLQHELACVALQSPAIRLPPAHTVAWDFFALYISDHPDASSDADLEKIDAIRWETVQVRSVRGAALSTPAESVLCGSPAASGDEPDPGEIDRRYPVRILEERLDGKLASFFLSEGTDSRHVVLRGKESRVTRRHGEILRSGPALLPDAATLCLTAWMHGVFGAQLTLGNTSFHKLFSVSRDPYNVMRSSGLRILIEHDGAWAALAVPSFFEMGLSDCRWIYCLGSRTVSIDVRTSGTDAAAQWRVSVEGEPARFLVYGHLTLGERELEQAALIEVDVAAKRCSFRPDPASLWGRHYPQAVYHLVTSTPVAIDAIGGDELLYSDATFRNGPYIAMRTRPTRELCFAVVGSLTDPRSAEHLAGKYAARVEESALAREAVDYWSSVLRGVRVVGSRADARALDAILPWLAHDAVVHLTVPHGLEQFTGAAWGTRDVCQGPVELLLALEHDAPVREILRIVFAQQYAGRGDWPQWFMLEPYSAIQDRHSHGDVIVWPLKALNDYVEATGDLAFLDEPVAWRDLDTLERTQHSEPLRAHADKLLDTVAARFVPGTHLIRYGEGDWNDSLQPADPGMRDWMASSWTVALLYQQVRRYAEILRRAGDGSRAADLEQLAQRMQADFNRFLVRDGTVAGYALFSPEREPELLIHPSDTRTGLTYSLLPMTRSIIGGMFTAEQARHHLRIIREHLLAPDGARLLDRPVRYRGGPERTFRRAESAAFFGREIGLMYVHAHIRYGEAMAVLGEAQALWEALQIVNPAAVNERLPHALPRQRNAYFSSSDAAFADRYTASAEYGRVKDASIGYDGGWRIYSSGPGIYTSLLVCHAFGRRREWGKRITHPLLPDACTALALRSDIHA